MRQQALLAHGPAMVSFVRAHTPLEFAWVPGYADYYPEAPGGLATGRSIEPVPLNARVLGPELARLNPPYLPAPEGVTITQGDYRWLSLGPRHPRAMLASAKIAGRMARGRLLRQHTLSMGQALAAGLRAGLLTAQVPVWLDTPLTGLEMTGRPRHRGPGHPRRPARGHRGEPRRGAGRGRLRAQRARCGGATSASRSAPNGRPARPATPATRSSRARPPGRRST